MKFSTVLLALVPAALAMPAIEARDANQVTADVGTIAADLKTLNNTLNGYKSDKDFASPLKVQSESMTTVNDINKATNDTNNSPAFDQDGSNKVATAVVALVPQIQSVLDNLVSKKPLFKKALFGFDASPLVVSDLKQQRNATAYLGKALQAKLSQPYAAFAPQISAQIDQYFAQAIANYSSGSPFPGFPGFPGQ